MLTIDLLAARLAFERTAVALYAAFIDAIGRAKDPLLARAVEKLATIRFEEAEHREWLEHRLRDLDADPAERTHRVELGETESRGIIDVALDGARAPGDILHAILAAELLDHAGWNALLQLAAENHDEEAQDALRKRLHEENDHLHFVRLLDTAVTRRAMSGEITDVRRKAA